MQTIRLRVNNKIYKQLMGFLKRFKKDELQIIKEDSEFISVQEYLNSELSEVENNKADFIDLDQLDQELENTICRYED